MHLAQVQVVNLAGGGFTLLGGSGESWYQRSFPFLSSYRGNVRNFTFYELSVIWTTVCHVTADAGKVALCVT